MTKATTKKATKPPSKSAPTSEGSSAKSGEVAVAEAITAELHALPADEHTRSRSQADGREG